MSEASRAWSWRHAFASSDLAATTKAVLHTLGMFMNELGEGCYPSVADICRYSGLDKKTVLKHLGAAREAGWIAISQHGYRGQKWKRQEYAARWPQRDLVAACPPSDDEGGGAAPPPSGGQKVVEQGGEGGGIEGSKVVEQVHQDKTSPETTPITSPVERERERGDAQAGANPEPVEPAESRKAAATSAETAREAKQAEAEGWALLQNWPGFAGMPKEPAMAIWRTLSPQDRATARRRFLPWLELLKKQKKTHIPAPSTYLRERLFEAVADPAEAPPSPVEVAPFGKLWNALRLADLLGGPGALPAPSAFIAGLIAAGGAAGQAEQLRHQAKHGWPTVNRMDDRAASRRGWTVTQQAADRLGALAAGFAQLAVGGERWDEWRAAFERRGWPWLPDPGQLGWVYLPAGAPDDALEAFDQALRNPPQEPSEAKADDDADRPQAAE